MARKKNDKKIVRLEPEFHNVLVCKKNDCRPFVEILIERPENVSLQNLGVLVGIFQINDYSEDSSYIVNYLISIIKKEYFSRTTRGSIESFEAALHKANLALAKLATHESVGWVGNINAICAVIEKNNLLLSQTGNASAFLLRKTAFTEITEPYEERADVAPNPLKTFQDVISGKIENNDKLIFTTKDIFDIFSTEEIKRSALKFARDKFIQFLNTALINELEQAVTLVIDMNEKTDETVKLLPPKKIENINIFSQTAFKKEVPLKKVEKKEKSSEDETLTYSDSRKDIYNQKIAESVKDIEKEDNGNSGVDALPEVDFVDSKTGHIYIKEDDDSNNENQTNKVQVDFSGLSSKLEDFFSVISEKTAILKSKAKKLGSILWKNCSSKISQIKTDSRLQLEKKVPIVRDRLSKTGKVVSRENIKKAYLRLGLSSKFALLLKKTKSFLDWSRNKIADGVVLVLNKPIRKAIDGHAVLKKKIQLSKNEASNEVDGMGKTSFWSKLLLMWQSFLKKVKRQKILTSFFGKLVDFGKKIEPKKALPNFSRIKKNAKSFDKKQKIVVMVVLVLLVVVPYLIVKWSNMKSEEVVPVQQEEIVETPISSKLPLEKDLNVNRTVINDVYQGKVDKLIDLRNKFFALKGSEIIDLANKRSIAIPVDFHNPDMFFSMTDLNLIFLVKNNRITSFSPAVGKFENVKFSFPSNGKVIDIDTYMTYVYLLDVGNNQIYRSARIEGGFGEGERWLNEKIDLSNAKDIAINENIFLINGQDILKLSGRKKQAFVLEKSATPILPDKLYAKDDHDKVYVLDKTNSRIIRFDNDGKIVDQYYNSIFSETTDFSVDEENGIVYFLNSDGVKGFGLNL